ncbi:uncharacterized protein LOC101454835 [Ceratitis capitata]|uniref:(Mediterranean fruit fly) hypothetical protein n=1 Tax=Ceratitis capitata TaxID=7213 RepID=A0A811TYX7_CERCA|nr:uncharacterized protein LOC101454835 [Ceratitis capitata]CAD6991939.1 unnamed protein product [Ceratitis capitata]
MLGAQRPPWLALCIFGGLSTFTLLTTTKALPATTPLPHTTHIVSYVHQGRAGAKSGDIREFDYESIQSGSNERNAALRSTEPPTAISQLYGAFVEQLDMSLDNGLPGINSSSKIAASSTEKVRQTDDLQDTHQNTLDDVFTVNEQHESSKVGKNVSQSHAGGLMWNRMKQSIPVLEPVRHLLNTVREQHNQTVHAARQHHQLLATMITGMGDHMPSNESSAIETEEDREAANESTEFKLLDFAGSLVGMIWGFIGNLQRAFAASSGNALASSSSGSSGDQ